MLINSKKVKSFKHIAFIGHKKILKYAKLIFQQIINVTCV